MDFTFKGVLGCFKDFLRAFHAVKLGSIACHPFFYFALFLTFFYMMALPLKNVCSKCHLEHPINDLRMHSFIAANLRPIYGLKMPAFWLNEKEKGRVV